MTAINVVDRWRRRRWGRSWIRVSCHDIAAIWAAFFSRSLLTGRLVDWLDPWRIVELEQAVLNAQVRRTAKTAALIRFTI